MDYKSSRRLDNLTILSVSLRLFVVFSFLGLWAKVSLDKWTRLQDLLY